jgi:hypothetical protein
MAGASRPVLNRGSLMVSRLPLYEQVAAPDRIDAWLNAYGQRIPLRIVDTDEALTKYLPPDSPAAVALPGAPRAGAEAAQAREIADRLEDVRVACALLGGAAAQVLAAVDGRLSASPLRSRAWARPALAAVKPLRSIIEAADEFENALATPVEGLAAKGDASPDDGDVESTTWLDRRTIAAVGRAPPIIAATSILARLPNLPPLPRLPNLPWIPTLVAEEPASSNAPPALSDAEAAALLAQRPWSSACAPPTLSADELAELERVGLSLRESAQ